MSLSSPAAEPIVPPGIPCWVELACTDETRSQSFYSNIFGWTYTVNRDPATPTGRYSIAELNGVPAGGLYRGPSDGAAGWTVHLAVLHTANTAEWVDSLGGQVTLGPVQIPNRGSILHAVDPSGAPVVFWEPADDWQFATGVPNSFTGADLNTHDGVAADHFFCRLFNYTSEQISGNTENIDYTAWHIGQQPMLYRYVMGAEYRRETPPHWMVYFQVAPERGVDAVAGQALMMGGQVVIRPYDTAYGRVAILADPDGAVFAVIDHSRVVEGIGLAEVDDPYDD